MKKLILALALLSSALLGAFEYRIVCGKYDVTITETYKHTIRIFKYDGYTIGPRTGYYGTIVVNKSGGYIGAGHKEGGVEKVLSARLTVDGKAATPAANAVFNARQSAVLEKISRFDNAIFNIRLIFSPEAVIEQKRFVTVADQKFHSFYSHQYCWDSKTTHWFALDDAGKQLAGKFSGKRGAWHCNKSVKYIAQYNADKKSGIMMYYPQIIPGALRRSTIWEIPKSYNKYYMITKVPKVCPAGFNSPEYTVVLRGFAADSPENCPAVLAAEAEKVSKIKIEPMAKVEIPK